MARGRARRSRLGRFTGRWAVAPFARQRDLGGLESLAHDRVDPEIEAGLDLSGDRSTAHQIRPTLASEHEFERGDQDALARPRLPRQHVQPRAELQLDLVDNREIFDFQAAEHEDQRSSIGRTTDQEFSVK
jgi:hypothetical protein